MAKNFEKLIFASKDRRGVMYARTDKRPGHNDELTQTKHQAKLPLHDGKDSR
jgi:hypothetical protein